MFDHERASSGSGPIIGARSSRIVRMGTAVGTALAVASAALATQASAATLVPNKACYVNDDTAVGAPMIITGSGFVPGGEVNLSGDQVDASTTATSAGTVVFSGPGAQAPILPTIAPASVATPLQAIETDPNTFATIATAQTTVVSANLAVATTPSSVKNLHKDKVKFSFSGFTPGKNIYGFYARKKIVAKTKFGKAKGACGMLTKRALLYPGGHPHHAEFKVSFESRSKYSKKANPLLTAELSILNF